MSSELAEGPGRGGAQKNPWGSTASARPAVSPGGLHSLGTVAGTSSGRVSALPLAGTRLKVEQRSGGRHSKPTGGVQTAVFPQPLGTGRGRPPALGPAQPWPNREQEEIAVCPCE